MRASKQSAFTLVELLVVITIIGMLMAMLLPAIGAAKGAARKAKCINNQREVGFALLNYENKRERFTGYVNPLDGKEVSWAVTILQELGRSDLYDAWANGGSPDNQIEVMLCPSDVQTQSGAVTSYIVNCGTADKGSAPFDLRANGIFHERVSTTSKPVNVTLSYIQDNDGLATTLMLSENIGAGKYTNTTEFATGFLWKDATSKGINFPTFEDKPADPGTAEEHARITSSHSGGAIVCFADRHARFLSDNIDKQVYALLCTPAGNDSDPIQSTWSLSPLSEAELDK